VGLGKGVRMKIVLLALCLFCAAPGAASAAVHVDPNSPSGQEYALPLDDARGDAVGGDHSDSDAAAPGPRGGGGGQSGGTGASGSAPSAPAFGVGLSGRSRGGRGRQGKTVGGGKPQTSDAAGSGGGSVPAPVGTRTAASTSAGGLGSTLLFSGLGIGTLVLGAAAGVVLRRRLQRNAF
jgi:hypothetical protein